jgi:hypothetical protein
LGWQEKKINEREEGSFSSKFNHLLQYEWWLKKLVGKTKDICNNIN